MNTPVWAARSALALALLTHGLLFPFPPEPPRRLTKGMPFSAGFLRFICVAEGLGAPGLPGLRGVLPWLTPLAAAGPMPIAGGAVLHRSWGEAPPMVITAALFVLAALVAYARAYVIPF